MRHFTFSFDKHWRRNIAGKIVAMCSLWLLLLSTYCFAQNYGLPRGARIIETQSLKAQGYPDRVLLLWMIKPKKYPRDDDDAYTCPEETTGSSFSGPTRVSLFDSARGQIINTLKVRDEHLDKQDTFTLPYRIHAGSYYHVPGRRAGKEGKPKLMWLRDYNGDGKALEFALFEALSCMGLETTLIGYSTQQDRVIQYRIHLRTTGEGKLTRSASLWCDYLFSLKPCAPGYWRFEIDYRGRGGSLDHYEIRYNAKAERFEGRCKWTAQAPGFVPYFMPPHRRCAKR